MRFNGSLYGVSKKDLMLKAEELKAEELRINLAGTDGKAGVSGTDGAQGLQGEPGLNGADGEPGRQGETGAQGLQGEPGRQGETGAQGRQGEPAPPTTGFTGEVVVSDGRRQSILEFSNGILTGVT